MKTHKFPLLSLILAASLLAGCQVGLSASSVPPSLPTPGPSSAPSQEPQPTPLPTTSPTSSPTSAPSVAPTPSPSATASASTRPPATDNLVTLLQSNPQFSTLVQQLTRPEMAEVLNQLNAMGATTTTYTVFAPNNDAFAKLSEAERTALLNDIPRLKNTLLYHVISGDLPMSEAVKIDKVETLLNDNSLFIGIDAEGRTRINDATVRGSVDLVATNGYLHEIDTLLIPGSFIAPSPSPSPTATP